MNNNQNIFNTNQGNNPFQNSQQGANVFNQQQQQNNPFNNQNQKQGNIFGNQNQQGNVSTNQQSNSPFANQNQSGNVFGNQNQGGMLNTNQGTNVFNQGNQGTNVFNQGNQGANVFNQQSGNNFIPNQNQGNTMFGNQQNKSNVFTGQQQNTFSNQSNNIYNGQQQTGFPGNQQQTYNALRDLAQNAPFVNMQSLNENQIQQIKKCLQQLARTLDSRNLQALRIDEDNMYKSQKIAGFQGDIKNSFQVLHNNMKSLRQFVDNIKKKNDEMEKKSKEYCEKVQQKLIKYKECLTQNLAQKSLLEEVREEVDLIDKEIKQFLIPLYDSFKNGRPFKFQSPNDFSLKIAKKTLARMVELRNKVDQILACQQSTENQQFSQQDSNTLLVLQQLVQYYENVSAKVFQFSKQYEQFKTLITNKYSDRGTVNSLRKIKEKVDEKLKKDFKSYDLIKEIEGILNKREKRQAEEEQQRQKNKGWISYQGRA